MKTNKTRHTTILILLIFITNFIYSQNNSTEILNRAKLLMIDGNYVGAIKALKSLTEIDSTNVDALYILGTAYKSISDFSKSASVFNHAIKFKPNDPKILLALGDDYFSFGMMDEAEKIGQRAFEIDSTDNQIKLFLGRVYSDENKWENAEVIYSNLAASDSDNSYLFERLGKCKSSLGKTDAAIIDYNIAYQLNPQNLRNVLNLSYLYYLQKQIDSAISVVYTGLKYFPYSIDLVNRMGDIFFIVPNYSTASLYYLRAVSLGDSSSLTQKNIGICYYWEQDYDSAESYLTRSISLNSSDAISYYYLGASYKAQKRYKDAIYNFQQAAALLKNDFLSNTYIQLGASYQFYKKYQLAVEYYKDGLRENPSNTSTLFFIASVYDNNLHNNNTALYYYKRYLNESKNPDIKMKNYAQERLNILKNK